MYEWLEKEIGSIKTRRFHVIGGGLSVEDRNKLETLSPHFPSTYIQFLQQFGETHLYRLSTGYEVFVKGLPETISNRTHTIYLIGCHDDERVFFFDELLVPGGESPVFELDEEGFHKAADTFPEWLQAACRAARMRYDEEEWRAILQGPPPWTPEEQAIVERRRQFDCTLVGASPSGDLRFKVSNHSQGTLPFLSVGLRSKDGNFKGGAWLRTDQLRPGETTVIEKDCYKDLIAPEELELVPLPDPEPEDRARYWEFRKQ